MSSGRPRAVAVALVTVGDVHRHPRVFDCRARCCPDLSRRLGASPTTIGLLFASFGVTLLGVSIPMGAVSDRVGRRLPLVGGLVVLAASTCCSRSPTALPWLFAARLDAGRRGRRHLGRRLRADCRPLRPSRARPRDGPGHVGHRLRVHDRSSARRLAVRNRREPAAVPRRRRVSQRSAAAAFLFVPIPKTHEQRDVVPVGAVLREPAVASCAAAVVATAATIAMLEPVLPLFLASHLGDRSGPGRSAVRCRRCRLDGAASGLRTAHGPVGWTAADDGRPRADGGHAAAARPRLEL